MWTQILAGTAGGMVYALSGLANKKKKEGFVWSKFIPTLIVSGIVGGIAGVTAQDINVLMVAPAAVGLTAVVEKFCKAIWKKYSSK